MEAKLITYLFRNADYGNYGYNGRRWKIKNLFKLLAHRWVEHEKEGKPETDKVKSIIEGKKQLYRVPHSDVSPLIFSIA